MAGLSLGYEPMFLVGDEIRAGWLVVLALNYPPAELPGVRRLRQQLAPLAKGMGLR